jgi:hypothetical protein
MSAEIEKSYRRSSAISIPNSSTSSDGSGLPEMRCLRVTPYGNSMAINASLAEMVGTTRSRINMFMNKFRKLGFIDYNGRIEIHSSLLSVVLSE